MRTYLLAGLALGAVGLSGPALAKGTAGAAIPAAAMHGDKTTAMRHMHRFSWGHRIGGRWHAGYFAPGGWSAWRRPTAGVVLPSYWIQPAFHIPNYWTYGLPAPAHGYGWSRYYDDAVLTDGHGRVSDYRNGVHWDRGDADGEWRGAAPPRLPEYDVGAYGDYGVTYNGEDDSDDTDYRGTWTGTWTGEDGRTYSGTYSGRYRSEPRPHWHAEAYRGVPVPPYWGGYCSCAYGYYSAPVVTTVVIHPSVRTTTTTTFIEEQVVHAAPRKVARSKIIARRSVKGK